jgi:FlaA1/EpsC-like NDP-sugar epimerase
MGGFPGDNVGYLKNFLLDLPYPAKRALAISLDLSLCVLSIPVAWFLRLGDAPRFDQPMMMPMIASVLLAPPLMAMLGNYSMIFRYGGWNMLIAICRAMAIYSLPYAAIFLIVGVHGVPRTLGIIQPLVLLLMIGGTRFAVKLWLDDGVKRQQTSAKNRVLIYGAGQAGRQIRAALANGYHHKVVGFIDDSPSLTGRVLDGVSVFHSSDLVNIQSRLRATDLILAMPSIGRSRRATIIERVAKLPIHVRTLPGITELVNGQIKIGDVRELDISDLLGREAVPPNPLLLSRNVRDLNILVSGAGGSIGSEICRQVLGIGPARLVLVDQSEYALYSIHQELSERIARSGDAIEIIPVLASVTDERRMSEIFERWAPDTIYHAAAYKHVPLIEENCLEGIRNNVIGTLTAFRAAQRHGVRNFVLVSTDKAVRPTNVMGASKRLAEQVLQALAVTSETCVSIVRFGNVLGSSGSVVPLFRRQIDQGGPVTITHPDVIRYFMTIPEAAQLVIQAGALASGGEVFVLDMGNPVRIADLARNMIELSGLTVKTDDYPAGDIEIVVTGLRKGEKLFEELLIGNNPQSTIHPRIMRAQEAHLSWDQLSILIGKLEGHIDGLDNKAALDLLWNTIAWDSDTTLACAI